MPRMVFIGGFTPLVYRAKNTSSAAGNENVNPFGKGGIVGDFCLIVMGARENGVMTFPVPSGWTQFGSGRSSGTANGEVGINVIGKRLVSGDNVSIQVLTNVKTSGNWLETTTHCIFYTGGGNFSIIGSPAVQITQGNPTPQVLAVNGVGPPVLAVGVYGSAATNDTGSGFDTSDAKFQINGGANITPDFTAEYNDGDNNNNGYASLYVKAKAYNISPTTDISVDMSDDDWGNTLFGFGLRF